MKIKPLLPLILFVLAPWARAQTPLQPGDAVRFLSPDSAALNVTRDITRDGYLYLPVAGVINAAGLTVEELRKESIAALAAQGLFARLAVGRVAMPTAPIRFSGAVLYVGSMPFAPGRRLSSILALARPSEGADWMNIRLTDGTGRLLRIDASAPTFAGSPGDVLLRPGDTIFVPMRTTPNQVFVLGGVENPGSVDFEEGMSVQGAIQRAGGVSGHGDPNKVVVERAGKALTGSITLKRGDVVRVGLLAQRRYVAVQGAVLNPGIVEFKPGMTLSQVIAAAGGLSVKADSSRIEIKALGKGGGARYDYGAIKKGRLPDVEVHADDIVDVPLQGPGKGS